jgi:signal peptidase II
VKRGILVSTVAILVVILDQLTKVIVDKTIALNHGVVEVFPFFNLINIRNKGAAFGLFSGMGNIFFYIISFLAVSILIVYLTKVTNKVERISLAMILGGAVGNLIDRVFRGSVVDFIDLFVPGCVEPWCHWPAFNIADTALTVGIAIYLVASIKESFSKKKA